ncbi:MAG: DUF255 domain-containing protein [Gammaproteobacteria bacterium]|nr:DUF255 domain-containing protein [Gammaproteobacteria bacterium]
MYTIFISLTLSLKSSQLLSTILLTSFLLLSSSPVFSQDVSQTNTTTIQWHEWSNETFALAEEQNKLVLLDIGAEWCQFCKKMEAVTYTDPEVVKIVNENYIAIKADAEEPGDVQMLYGSFGVPGTIILTSDRDELNKRRGYIAPQQMQWHLLGNLQDAPDNTISANTNQ